MYMTKTSTDPEGPDPWTTKRNLDLIWAQKDVKDLGLGRESTLLLDCEISKVKDYTENTILLKEYTKDEILNGGLDGKSNILRHEDSYVKYQTEYLLHLRDYILQIADEAIDVPEYLKTHPFDEFMKQRQGAVVVNSH
jgi:hypothetical protein